MIVFGVLLIVSDGVERGVVVVGIGVAVEEGFGLGLGEEIVGIGVSGFVDSKDGLVVVSSVTAGFSVGWVVGIIAVGVGKILCLGEGMGIPFLPVAIGLMLGEEFT